MAKSELPQARPFKPVSCNSASDLRGIVLLSHHQYYSNFDDQYPKPAQQLTGFFPRPVLWFWGHEHRMSLYDQFALKSKLTAYVRCVGHGGMPVEVGGLKRNDAPLVLYDERVYETFDTEQVGFNGFLMLTLSRRTLTADYYTLDQDATKDPGLNPQSKPVSSEAWSVGGDGQLSGPKFSNVKSEAHASETGLHSGTFLTTSVFARLVHWFGESESQQISENAQGNCYMCGGTPLTEACCLARSGTPIRRRRSRKRESDRKGSAMGSTPR